jgi:transcription-repair coupling factor (superfamily II helicase)
MELLLQQLRATPEYQAFLKSVMEDTRLAGLGLPRAARLPLLAALHADLNRPILLLTDRADHALAFYDELSFWTKAPRYLFSEPTPLFYEDAAWGAQTRRDRLQVLTALSVYHLPFAEKPSTPPLIVASARAVMTRTLPRRDFLKACKRLAVGQSVSPEALVRQWAAIGYQAADTVLEAGQFSRRGGILDIWPSSEASPVRLDFFGDEVDTIRRFDPATQRTLAKLELVLVTPAREYLLSSDSSNKSNSSHSSKDDSDKLDDFDSSDKVSEFHIPLLHNIPASILDYLPPRALILVDDLSLVESMIGEVEEQAVKFRHESIEEGLLAQDFPVPYLTWAEMQDSLHDHPWLELGHSTESVGADSRPPLLAALFDHDTRFGGRLKPFTDYMAELVSRGDSIVIVSRQSKRLQELWEAADYALPPTGGDQASSAERSSPVFIEASLSEGWILHPSDSPFSIHLITDSEIFGWERPTPRTRAKPAAEAPEMAYADLRPGDWVVHVDHGIGRYAGLVQRHLDKHEREFLSVEYEGGAMVYVPVHQADRLTRYVGAEGETPNATRLGGTDWAAAKEKVRAAVKQVAEELLDLYARRQLAEGYTFGPDTGWQKELEDSFPYVETDDQVKALNEIKRDMENPRPMDRLLCGDVGYGKTEVALRAAFKAVMDGKQVAILVPTTVLAQQHYDTFRQRLAAFPVKVEMLSRFRTQREQNEILRALLLGKVDIIIGTHRLISQDVEFKELGLVIIDEEQRFGVTHKEHLKKLRTEVDVLTLTATPIPRTLYMALTGVRDISTLSTPPEERLPIITHVGPYAPRLVRQAILRELERGGQIFFVHNRVQTIHAMQMHLQKLAPEARMAIGHGQMDEHELSEVMHKFTEGHIDILLSTTIIESGLDIPNANTLIVDRADTFGLAQLYQLRGRVGRGAQRAYAYFFRHRKKSPTMEGQERLEVIAENTQLGAGYSIAMRDLEIRGAGELLGMRQSGHIQTVGFHLYTRMLAAEVKRLRRAAAAAMQGKTLQAKSIEAALAGIPIAAFDELAAELKEPVTVDLPLAVGIPRSYIPDQDLRLRLYRRLAGLRDERGVEAFVAEFADRFGPLPEMVQNLFYQMRVKLRAEAAGLQSVGTEAGQLVLKYQAISESMNQRALSDLGPGIRGGKNAYWCSFLKDDDWQERLLDVLGKLKERTVDVIDMKFLPSDS